MKFCKNLQRIIEISSPEWSPYWTNYRMLKKVIKELPSIVPADDDNDSSGSSVGAEKSKKRAKNSTANDTTISPSTSTESTSTNDRQPETKEKVIGKSPGEIVFFQALHSELKKAIHFFDKAQQEFSIREDRIIEGMKIMQKPNSIMMSNDRWACMAKSLYQFYKDLLLLETFAIMTYCSFSKILKKHDKVTGYQTRIAFMANVVNKANFTSYPELLEMIRRCESLYEEVSQKLKGQTKKDLCEDERLFISMIHRLNGQILDKAEKEEGAPVGITRKQSLSKIKELTHTSGSKEQNQKTTSLRTLLEENEVDRKKSAPSSPLLSDDGEDLPSQETKRKVSDSLPVVDDSKKRVKLS